MMQLVIGVRSSSRISRLWHFRDPGLGKIWNGADKRSGIAAGACKHAKLARQFTTDSKRILVTGAAGQVGSEMMPFLREHCGAGKVIGSDIKLPACDSDDSTDSQFVYCDVLSKKELERIVLEYNVGCIVHNASMLSAVGENNPQLALTVNTRGAENVLEIAREQKCRVFIPSTIAVFGPGTPQENTPDQTITRPTTVYGISKVYMELIGEYYHSRYGVDFRSLRYPGIISSEALPGGGTTDYAVEIFYKALTEGHYSCFLEKDTRLPMMYMPDCLNATLQLMEADSEKLTQRVFNVTSMSFTPMELCQAIQRHIKHFKMDYAVDFRQKIAQTWPSSIDDTPARNDWNWNPQFDLNAMTEDMLAKLSNKLSSSQSISVHPVT